MQQIYRRTPMPKCDFNKVAIEITLRHGCSSVNLWHIFRTTFPKNTYGCYEYLVSSLIFTTTQFRTPLEYPIWAVSVFNWSIAESNTKNRKLIVYLTECCYLFCPSLFYTVCNFRCGVAVITIAQLHSTKSELRFCAGSNPASGVLEIRDGEDLWQWSRLEIRLIAFRRSTIPQKQFIIIINIKSFANE